MTEDKIDINALDAVTRAKHLANPTGAIGMAIADQISATNAQVNAVAFQLLKLGAGDRILEIGFGNGKLIPKVLALAADLFYAGIDISETMVEEATSFNRALIEAGRLVIRRASSNAIPFADASFTRALAINVIYFWSEPISDLREIHRILTPNGYLVFAAVTPRYAETLAVTKHGFRIHDEAALIRLARAAGFDNVDVQVEQHSVIDSTGQVREREFYMVVAAKAPG